MNISLIVAIAQNSAIGFNNKLPWYLPEDLERFKKITSGHPLIMGRKTFESLPGVLPGRKHYVITSDSNFSEKNERAKASSNVYVVNSPAQAIELIKTHIKDGVIENETPFVIGGGQIYKEMLPLCNKLYITYVKQEVAGDTFFPEINPDVWKEVDREIFDEFDFVIYDRI